MAALTDDERAEVLEVVDRLQEASEDLAVRGLSAAGQEQLTVLDAMHDELRRIGAGHLAGLFAELITAVREGGHDAAGSLLRARTSLRLFERVLTLETVGDDLACWLAEDEA